MQYVINTFYEDLSILDTDVTILCLAAARAISLAKYLFRNPMMIHGLQFRFLALRDH